DLPVQGDDLWVCGAESDKRVTVSLPGGHLLAHGVLRCPVAACGPGWLAFSSRNRLRARTAHHQVAAAAEFGDRPLGHVRRERPAVPAFFVLDFGKPPALDGLGHDDRGLLARGLAGLRQRAVDRGEIMAVDDQYPGAERLSSAGV